MGEFSFSQVSKRGTRLGVRKRKLFDDEIFRKALRPHKAAASDKAQLNTWNCFEKEAKAHFKAPPMGFSSQFTKAEMPQSA